MQSIGPHYAKTLATWRKNFQTNWETEIKPMILREKMADEEKRTGGAPDAEGQKRLEWEAGVLRRKWEVRPQLIHAHFCLGRGIVLLTSF